MRIDPLRPAKINPHTYNALLAQKGSTLRLPVITGETRGRRTPASLAWSTKSRTPRV